MTHITARPTRVRITSSGVQRITLDRTTVAAIRQGVRGATGAQGPQGEQGEVGPAGPSSAGVAPIAFSWGDASSVIWTPSDSGTLVVARLVIETAFDGAGAALTLGTNAAPAAIMSADQNAPGETGEYEVTADLALSAGTGVRLTITPGAGASQGAGLIYLIFLPD
jgi:hypothetical protein